MKAKIFLKAVEIGIKHKFPHWDSTNVGILGVAMADLLMERLNYELFSVKYDDENIDELLYKLMKLSYLFLTRRLEVSSSNAHEIYEKRAYLVQNYGAALFGEQVDDKDGIISDHYYASLAYTEKRFKDDAEKQMEEAKLLYHKYNSEENATTEELLMTSEEGMLKNYKLYDELLKEYQESKLDIAEEEFEEYFNNNEALVLV
ncbi:MAG: hypothetical protein ABFS12_12815 [Bacteroidota bacterium]